VKQRSNHRVGERKDERANHGKKKGKPLRKVREHFGFDPEPLNGNWTRINVWADTERVGRELPPISIETGGEERNNGRPFDPVYAEDRPIDLQKVASWQTFNVPKGEKNK